MVDLWAFSAGAGKEKKGKGGAASDAPKISSLSNEVKSTIVVGANIMKDGTDLKVFLDSDYPDWLCRLIDKKPALSELRRKNTEFLLMKISNASSSWTPEQESRKITPLRPRTNIKEMCKRPCSLAKYNCLVPYLIELHALNYKMELAGV